MNENKQTVDSGFDGLGIKDTILASIKKLGFTEPTPIQAKTIPVGLAGQDLIGIAQTGTGKTFAFGIPMLQRIGALGGRGLILLPTRELALQVEDNLKKLGTSLGLKTATFIGGEAQERQLYALRRNPHIIIATPGRLIDYLKRRILTLDDIKVLVLDEADMMFDLGFAPQVEEILTKVPVDRQTMLFSATMPMSIVKLTTNHMKMPVRIEAAPSGTAAERVDQEMYIMHKDDRIKHLERVLNEYQGSVLLFVRTKHSVTALTEQIIKFGHTASEIHSNLSLRNRRKALDDFKAGRARVLVATDIAARGLDVNGIELVINYNLPDKLSDYVHRIGRTGRAGKSGKAISFATPDQARDIRDIERLINQPIALTKYAEPQSFGGSRSGSSKGRGYGAKPSRFTTKPGFEKKHRDFSEKYTPSLNSTTEKNTRTPYKKFDQDSRGPKKFGYVAKDTFERDQRMNHLPRFNNKPDFSTFNFVEDAPTPRTARRESVKPRSFGDKKPFSKTSGSSVRPSKYEGSKPRTFEKPAYGEKRTSSYEGFKSRTTGDEKRTFGGANRTSSYHSGRPATGKKYDGPSSYKSKSESTDFGSKSTRPVKSNYGKSNFGARKTDSRPARPFKAKGKPGFKKPR